MKIPPVVADVLKVAAPTLLTALLGPLGGVAATIATSALDKWMGIDVARGALPIAPEAVVASIQKNMDNPNFVLDLRKAELDLQKYENDLTFKFAELEVKDKQSSRDFQAQSNTAGPLMKWGMAIVGVSLLSLLTVVLGSLLLIAGFVRIPAETVQMAVGVFGLIGSITGYISSYGTQILSFYYGDSAGSQNKTNALTEALQTSGAQLGEAAATASKVAAAAADKAPSVPQVVVVPAAPAAVIPAVPVAVDWQRGPFGGVRWQLLPEGVLVEGDTAPGRTVGEPITVRRIWRDFGSIIEASCARNGVPAELVVACIATESRGIINATLKEPDGRQSVGLMQTLLGTAGEVMGREITYAELITPEVSIEAGTRYLKRQYDKTKFQPPLAAAAYNAGGLYEARDQDNNRWNLRSTGDHIDRFVLYFNDALFVAKSDNWSKAPPVA